jgi:hypothetical protein
MLEGTTTTTIATTKPITTTTRKAKKRSETKQLQKESQNGREMKETK